MKKRIFLSICTIIICMMAVVGVSYAVLKDETIVPGSIVVGNVDVKAEISKDGENIENIEIDVIKPGVTYYYDVELTNDGSYDVRYRHIFDVTTTVDITDILDITVSNEEINFLGGRGVSKWVTNFDSKETKTYKIKIELAESFDPMYAGVEFGFELKIEAIEDRFVEVSTQDDLNELVDGEYAILTKDLKDLEINKSIYLDLNGFCIDNLDIISNNALTVEILNGSLEQLYVLAPESDIYCYAYFKSGTVNTNTDCFYYLSDQVDSSEITIEGGTVVIDTNATVDIKTDLQGKEITLMVNSSVEELIVNDDITIINTGVINSLVHQDGDVTILGNDVLDDIYSEKSVYVSEDETPYYILENGLTKRLEVLTFEEALESDYKNIILSSNTYDVTSLEMTDVSFLGQGEVAFNLSNELTINTNLSFDNISFNNTLNIYADSFTATNCKFSSDVALDINELNEITLENNIYQDTNAILINADTTDIVLEGSNVLYYTTSKKVVSQDQSSLFLTVDNKKIEYISEYTSLDNLEGEVYLKGLYTIDNTLELTSDINIIGYDAVIVNSNNFTGNSLLYIDANYSSNNVEYKTTNNSIALVLENKENTVVTTNSTFTNVLNEVCIYVSGEVLVSYSGDGDVIYKHTDKVVVGVSINDEYFIDESTVYLVNHTSLTSDLSGVVYITGTHELDSLTITNDITLIGHNATLKSNLNIEECNVVLINCLIESNTSIKVESASLVIEDSVIDSSSDVAIESFNSQVTLLNNTINANTYGVYLEESTVLEDSSVYNSTKRYLTLKTDKVLVGKSNEFFLEEDNQDVIKYVVTHTSLTDSLINEEVYVLSGSYTISKTIELTNDVSIISLGEVTIKNSVFNKIDSFINTNDFDLTIKGINFLNLSVVSITTKGIVTGTIGSVVIDDCDFGTFPNETLVLNCENAVVNNCKFITSTKAITINGCNTVMTNCSFTACVTGIYLLNGANLSIDTTTFSTCDKAIVVDKLENEDTSLVLGDSMVEDLVVEYIESEEDQDDGLLDDLLDDALGALKDVVVKNQIEYKETIKLTETYDIETNTLIKTEIALKVLTVIKEVYGYDEVTYENILEIYNIIEDEEIEFEFILESYEIYHTDFAIVIDSVIVIKMI